MSSLAPALALLVVLVLCEFPIAFSFAAAGIAYSLLSGVDIGPILATAFWETGSFALIALPLFIVAGNLMAEAKISDRLVAVVELATARVRGGLGTVTVVSCALFGAISGSGAAAIAAIGSIMLPRLRSAGYEPGYAVGLIACSSVLALLIPPSIPMIVFALTAGLSVSQCFMSTIVPAIIIALLYILLNRREAGLRGIDSPRTTGSDRREPVATTLFAGIPALLMPIIMVGGIYGGIFTPTEASAVALGYGLFVGIAVYRTLKPGNTFRAFHRGAETTATIIAILFFLIVFSKLLSIQNIPSHITASILAVSENRTITLLMINLALLIIGMFLDDISGSILAAVILLPVAREIGIDPIHFAAIVGTNLGLGNVTPPCAPLLYVAGSVGGLQLRQFVLPALRLMVFGHLPVVLLVTYVPAVSLTLPAMMN